MTGPGLPGRAEILGFAARVAQGGLSEPERADLAVLAVLVGAGLRTHAAIGRAHPGDRARQDEFAVCLWWLGCDLVASMLAGAGR